MSPNARPKSPQRRPHSPGKRLAGSERTKLLEVLDSRTPDRQAEFDMDMKIADLILPDYARAGIRTLSLHRRRYVACLELEAQVNNGGFMQFFDNCGPVVAKEALRFLDQRGPKRIAVLLRRAMAAFPGGKLPPTIEAVVEITLADSGPDGAPGRLGRKLDKIDSAFYDGDSGPALIRARLEYARDHADEFFK